MNTHEKLQKIKLELLSCNLKKSGKNKFAGFDYYELSDIMPDIIRLCEKYKLYTIVDFHSEQATLTAYDWEDLNSESLTVCSPVVPLEIRGANAIQALGGMQTYLRRYLYIAMFDITENDQFDAVSGKKEEIKKYCCEDCGAEFKPFTDMKKNKWCSAKDAFEQVKKKYGKAICKDCREKPKGAAENG